MNCCSKTYADSETYADIEATDEACARSFAKKQTNINKPPYYTGYTISIYIINIAIFLAYY